MTLLYYHPIFLEHDTGDHPENMNRLIAVNRGLAQSGLDSLCVRPTWNPLSASDVEKIHTAEYWERLCEFAHSGGGYYDPDTIVGSRSVTVALMAAGAACDAARRVALGESKSALCLIRPPGHHALPSRAMGFCLLNNVALAAKMAIADFGIQRTMIVDWDVHHGNGTQEIFWRDAEVGYYSIHRSAFYPFTGEASETGEGAGSGATRNIPVRFGTSRNEYLAGFAESLEEFTNRIKPQLILISAGFDAHADDPIGSLGLATEDFAELTRIVMRLADRHSEGRIVSVLEGGYDERALADSVRKHLEVLLEAN
jgi:acetoin utilization deacetylase AcuC-like enzyme